MKRLYTPLGVVLLTFLLLSGARAQTVSGNGASQLADARSAMAREATTFIENKGQWNPAARFLARTNGLDLWVTDEGLTYDLYRMERGNGTAENGARRMGHVVRMSFQGAGSDASAQGVGRLAGTYNYYGGKDASKWAAGVPRYSQARIDHLYNGIDAALYIDQGRPRYDLLVAPGADPSAIRINYEGASSLSVNRSGDLVIGTSLGDVKQQGLFAYQLVNGEKRQVACSFKLLADNGVGFKMGAYDRSQPLVIDPIIYSTYIGGNGYDEPRAIASDLAGKLYITGYTLSANFPTVAGSYRTTYGGTVSGMPPGGDVFVSKIDLTQSPANQLTYSTYIGSTEDEVASDIAVDVLGNAYITGVAGNLFPTTQAVTPILNDGIFAVKLSASGGTLSYSTFVADDAFSTEGGITVDNLGQAVITGSTSQASFPAFANAFQPVIATGADAFVARVAANGAGLTYATFIGGNGDDVGTDIAIEGASIFVGGYTNSTNFPMLASTAYDSSYNGNTDGFVVRLEPTVLTGTSQLTYSTHVGGTDYDEVNALVVDSFGYISVTGMTTSANLPMANAFMPTYSGATSGDGDAFVMKINPFVARASQLIFSTYLGGTSSDAGHDIALDANRDIYVTGWTASSNFQTSSNAYRTTLAGDSADAFVAKFSGNGAMRYSSFLGGNGGDRGNGIAITAVNEINLTGYTWSTNFPVSPNALQAAKNSSGLEGGPDGFVTRLGILEVTMPVGGEKLCAGTVQNVTWTGGASTNYDLYLSSNGGTTYNVLSLNVVGTTFAWPIPASFPAGTRYRLKVMVSGGAENDASDSNFTINTPPTVTLPPNNVTQPQGSTATFTAIASGTPAPTVQWEVNNGSGTWVAIPGATSTTLTLTNINSAQSGNQYRAVFTNTCASVASPTATLTVSSVRIVSPNGGEQWCAGTVQRIVWTAGTDGGPYDVSVSKDGGQSWQTLATTLTDTSFAWSIPGTTVGLQFLAQVRTSNGQTSDISDHSFAINTTARVAKQPGSVTSQVGNQAVFNSEATGQPIPTVQWEMNTGGGWTPVTGATGPNLGVPVTSASQNGTRYRAIYSNSCGSDTTVEVTLTVITAGVDDPTTGLGALRMSVAPNPITGSGDVRVALPHAAHVRIDVADINGNVVANLADRAMPAGDNQVTFNAAGLPSGAYMVILNTNGERRMVKVTVAK